METIAIPGAEIYYERNFLAAEEATKLFDLLQAKCAWERRKTLFKAAVPRDEAYYGDPGTNYTYSRREYKPLHDEFTKRISRDRNQLARIRRIRTRRRRHARRPHTARRTSCVLRA
jgi:hypothetical protein